MLGLAVVDRLRPGRGARAGAEVVRPPTPPVQVAGTQATPWWAMGLLVAVLAVFLASLLAGYYYLRAHAAAWPPAGIAPPGLLLPALATAVLLLSGATMRLAHAGIRRADQRRLGLGLALSFLLGGAFVALGVVDYLRAPFSPRAHAYAAIFYTLGGYQGALALVGLLMIAVVGARAWLGHFDPQRHLAVQNTALYWYFVAAAGLAIFLTSYLYPRLS